VDEGDGGLADACVAAQDDGPPPGPIPTLQYARGCQFSTPFAESGGVGLDEFILMALAGEQQVVGQGCPAHGDREPASVVHQFLQLGGRLGEVVDLPRVVGFVIRPVVHEPREQAALGGGGDTVREVLFLGGGEAEVRSGQPGLVWRWQVGVDAGGHAAAGVRVVGGGAPV